MLLVHCAVDDCVGKFRYGCQRCGIFKAVFFGKTKHFARLIAADGVGVRNAHDFEKLRLLQREFCVNERTVSRADNNGGNRFMRHITHLILQIF